MMCIAMGEMGISLDDFLDLSPFQFSELYLHWAKEKEENEKNEWEKVRYLAFAVVAPHLDNKKHNTPQSVFPFPWDKKKNPPKPSTRERFEHLKRLWR